MSALLDQILHDYDPAAARAYYLRTRELKGRRKGNAEVTNVRTYGPRPSSSPRPKGPVVVPTKRQPSAALQKRRETAARIEALTGRLEKLRDVLKTLVEQAKARSGIETKPTKSNSPVKKANPAGSAKPSAAQKREAAKAAKERYDKEKKPPSLTSKEKQLQDQVKAIQEKIVKARAELKASIESAKKKKASVNPAAASRRNS